jgi:phytoene dehydrogenase-like protein
MGKQTKILIIGAGVAGLSAGIYAQMNGFDSTIYEMHRIPGGLCTSWRRRGYVFDGAVRYLTSLCPNTKGNQLWAELGILDDKPIHFYEQLLTFEGRDGRQLHIYTDVDRLEAHLLDLAPEDAPVIREFTNGIRDFRRLDLPVDLTAGDLIELANMGREMTPVLIPTLRWRGVTLLEFSQRFKNPFLRESLPLFFQFAPPDFPIMLCLSTLAMMNDREAGYPLGGSLSIAQALEARYLSLGGKVKYRSHVTEVLVQDDRAVGLALEGGQQVFGDIIISAADGRTTIFDLLGGKYTDRKLEEIYQGGMTPSQSILQVSLGVAMDFSDLPPMINFPLSEAVYLGNLRHERLVLKHYCFDPHMAPAGKSALTLWCAADYDYWKWLYGDQTRYKHQKQDVAQIIIDQLEHRYPGLRAAVEVVDVATPVTYERYTGNWRGAFAGWGLTTKKLSMMMGIGMPKTLQGLDGFYMHGQWVEPGGNVELSCGSGRDVIKDICKAEGKEFFTEV